MEDELMLTLDKGDEDEDGDESIDLSAEDEDEGDEDEDEGESIDASAEDEDEGDEDEDEGDDEGEEERRGLRGLGLVALVGRRRRRRAATAAHPA